MTLARRLALLAIMAAVHVTGASSADAGPKPKTKPTAPDDSMHHVLVLPVDGNASSVLRAKLGESIKRLARTLDGSVTDGDTTFAEAALAVGCDPQAVACADQVLATLAVDEMVYATATTTTPATASITQGAGTTRVVVHRIGKGVPSREAIASLTSSDPPERVEPALQTLFPAAVIEPVTPVGPPVTTVTPVTRAMGTASIDAHADAHADAHSDARDDKRDRNVGIACATGGGLFVVIGVVLWMSESSIQSDIDHHPTITPNDFATLTSLENDASTRATLGNVMFASGLIAAGVGGYFLWRWRDSSVSVTPRPLDHGAAVSIGGHW